MSPTPAMTEAAPPQPSRLLTTPVREPWHRFLEEVEGLRPELYRYCRYLTRSPWDAEDLVQDTLARAFVSLGCTFQELASPKAWLFRVASNQWMNQMRRHRELLDDDLLARRAALAAGAAELADARLTREAAGTLVALLAPQERAAVVLKDVFDFSLEEIAEALSTTPGAIKAALHRGRGKLAEPPAEAKAPPPPAVLDAFVAAFNARDLDRLTSLLLESAVVEFPGLNIQYGAETARNTSFKGVLFGDPSGDRSGIAPAYRAGIVGKPPRLELRVHRGEPLLLGWFQHQDGEAVRAISRATVEGDRITYLRQYIHQPDVLAEICGELGVPFRSSGYRFWW